MNLKELNSFFLFNIHKITTLLKKNPVKSEALSAGMQTDACDWT